MNRKRIGIKARLRNIGKDVAGSRIDCNDGTLEIAEGIPGCLLNLGVDGELDRGTLHRAARKQGTDLLEELR